MERNSSIEDLIEYKKKVLADDRRDSRIRGSIYATLNFVNNHSSRSSNRNSNNSNTSNPFHNSKASHNYSSSSSTINGNYTPQRRNSLPGPLYNNTTAGSVDPSSLAMGMGPMAHTQNILPTNQFSPGDAPYKIPRSVIQLDLGSSYNLHDVEKLKSPNADSHDPHHHPGPTHLTWRERLKHFTFAWYTSTMSTGGVALVLAQIPFRFDALTTIGTILFVFNIILFLTLTSIMILRFSIHPETFKPAFTNPHEGFFFATFWLSFATMMTNSVAYGVPNTGPWLVEALEIAFWIYTVCVTILAVVYYYILFTVHKLVLTNVLPGWILPIFPAMLVGTLAAAIGKLLKPENALPMLVAGLSYQGLGFFLALMMYPLYFGRLLTSGLPADASRPAMFIAVGPPAFTGLAFIGMAQDVAVTKIFGSYTTLDGVVDQAFINDALSLLAILMAIFLWIFAFWFFMLAVIASYEGAKRNDFHLNWYAYVFPNVGFTIVTIRIGERLSSPIISQVGTAMGAMLFFLWILIVFCHIKAVLNKMIMWPGKDEDAAH